MLSDRPTYASLDADLRFLAVNDALLQFLGKRREELVGYLFFDVYPQARGGVLHQLIQQAWATLQPIKKRVWSDPLSTWMDVEVFPMNPGVQVAFTPIPGEPPAATVKA